MRKLFATFLAGHTVILGAGDMHRPETTHPRPVQVPAGWTCSECECNRLPSATICPHCYAALCVGCAAKLGHRVPAGERAGAPCGQVADTAA